MCLIPRLPRFGAPAPALPKPPVCCTRDRARRDFDIASEDSSDGRVDGAAGEKGQLGGTRAGLNGQAAASSDTLNSLYMRVRVYIENVSTPEAGGGASGTGLLRGRPIATSSSIDRGCHAALRDSHLLFGLHYLAMSRDPRTSLREDEERLLERSKISTRGCSSWHGKPAFQLPLFSRRSRAPPQLCLDESIYMLQLRMRPRGSVE